MRFSIITPSFRNSDWLRLCVASVADQAVDHEHLVHDAESDDGTLDWLPSDTRVDARIEKDGGMYDAINRGFKRAKGDILAWLNCDEQYLPGTLSAVEDWFRAHPDTEMLFADAIIVDAAGRYLFHRKIAPPRSLHTRLCHLASLSCAMFIRREVIHDRHLFLDPTFRCAGDAEWMLRVLDAGVRMGSMRRFASVFVNSGKNLSLNPEAVRESEILRSSLPRWIRRLKPLVAAQHRLRRAFNGHYRQKSFTFAAFSLKSPDCRMLQRVDHPTAIWKW